MRKKAYPKLWNSVELLEINTDRYLDEVQDELGIYNISIQTKSEQMEKQLNDVIEVELEEVQEETEVTRGVVHIIRDGSGKYYSVKNIKFSMIEFLEFGMDLVQNNQEFKFISCVVLLLKLMNRLGVDLEENQTAVCVALYNAEKHYVITDDNIIRNIANELKENDYIELSERKIRKVVSGLIEMGIVSIENGRYELTQKLLIE